MHWCANVVTGAEGVGQAVLVRAVAPLAGLEEMRARRGAARTDRDLCRGPGRLCQAFAITGDDDGTDLVRDARIWLGNDGQAPPSDPGVSRRIGLSKGIEPPWRWYVAGDPHVSGRNGRY
jgi:DNA-3-methyladenine glycosylase